jgi:hypothetical protein
MTQRQGPGLAASMPIVWLASVEPLMLEDLLISYPSVSAEAAAPVGGWDFDMGEASSTAAAKPHSLLTIAACRPPKHKGSVRHSQNGLCMYRIAACQ